MTRPSANDTHFAPPAATPGQIRILVWDLPTRVFHWLFAACFAGAWLSAEEEGWFAAHMLCGVLMLALALFRLAWGRVGGRYARFASFAHAPRAGLDYMRALLAGRAARHVGHNPAGAQAIRLLLALGLVTALAGLACWTWAAGAAGEILGEGHELLANLMLAVVIAHLVGVALESRLHRENLARAMLDGHKLAPDGTPASRVHGLAGALLLTACLVFAGAWLAWADFARPPDRHHEAEDDEADEHVIGPKRGAPPRLAACPARSGEGVRPRESGMGGTGLGDGRIIRV